MRLIYLKINCKEFTRKLLYSFKNHMYDALLKIPIGRKLMTKNTICLNKFTCLRPHKLAGQQEKWNVYKLPRFLKQYH